MFWPMVSAAKKKRFVLLGGLGALVLLLSVLRAQSSLVESVALLVRAAAKIRVPAPEELTDPEVLGEAPVELPPAPSLGDGDFAPLSGDEPDRSAAGARKGKTSSPKPLPTTLVSSEVVLGWVRRGVIPEIEYASPQGALPGGLRCPSASSFVPGLRAEDRLIRVDGAKVASLDDVVLRVAAARRERRKALLGTFCREDERGLKCTNLLVQLPSFESNDGDRAR